MSPENAAEDYAQDTTGRSGGKVTGAHIALIALVVLALVASIIMLVTDSAGALKLALLASLWAAILGFFLVSRYRRLADAAEAELDNEIALHDAELARIDAQQRANEEKLARLKAEAKNPAASSDDTAETLAEIRKELEQLRSHLEDITGWVFAEEPAVVRAEARRILELEEEASRKNKDQDSAASQTRQSLADKVKAPKQPAAAQTPSATSADPSDSADSPRPPKPKPSAPRGPRSFDTGAFAAVKWDDGGENKQKDPFADYFAGLEKQAAAAKQAQQAQKPAAAKPAAAKPEAKPTEQEKEKSAAAEAQEKAAQEAKARRLKEQAAKDTAEKAAAEKKAEAEKKAAEERKLAEKKAAEKKAADQKAADQKAAAEKKAAAEEEERRGGRRRRDERSGSITVAELLARRGEE